MKRSPDAIAWSIMCPAELQATTAKTAQKKVEFGGPQIPNWGDRFLWVPFLGRYISALLVGLLDMPTTYESVTDFMADDFVLGLESGLIGRKIAPNRAP